MELKKSVSADKTKKSGLFFLIGLNVVLALSLLLLEGSRDYKEPPPKPDNEEPTLVAEDVIIIERVFEEPPPPVEQVAPPEIPVEIEEVPDDIKIEDPKPIIDQKKPDIPPKTSTASGPPAPPAGPPVTKPKPGPAPKDNVDEKLNKATAKRGPIYPGCEKHKNDRRALYRCFDTEIGKDIRNYLDDFELESGEKTRKIQVSFVIDKNGNMNIKSINKGNAETEYVNNGKQAFQNLARNIERKNAKGKGIEPALNSNDQPGEMDYKITVKFEAER